MEQLQFVTRCVSSDGVATLYAMAPQWQLASYQVLVAGGELDIVDKWF